MTSSGGNARGDMISPGAWEGFAGLRDHITHPDTAGRCDPVVAEATGFSGTD